MKALFRDKAEARGLPEKNLLYLIIILVGVGFIVVNIIINLIWFKSFSDNIKRKGLEHLITLALSSVENIENFILGEIRNIKVLAQDVTFEENRRFFINRFLRENPAIREVSIVNLDGQEKERYSRFKYFSQKELRDFSFLEEFERAKAGEIFISRVDFSPEGEPYIIITLPIKMSETEKPRAVLRNVFYPRLAWEKSLEMKIEESGRISVIDDKGTLIADPDPKRVFKKTNLLDLPPVKPIILGQVFHGQEYLNEKGTKVFGVGAPIKSLKWGVVVEQDARELELASRETQKLMVLFLISGIVIILILSWLILILKRVDQVLKERYNALETRTKELEEIKNTLEIRVAARTKELEELAISLEEKVKERTKELQEKIEEMEKFQKLTVGREIVMIELKEEIKRLKEELEKQKRSDKKISLN